MSETGVVTLFRREGATSESITAYIRSDGGVVVEGYDVGEAPQKFWGDSDYEYLVYVAAKDKDRLMRALADARAPEEPAGPLGRAKAKARRLLADPALSPEEMGALADALGVAGEASDADPKDRLILALIAERFSGDATAVGSFQRFCKARGIKAHFWSWV